MITNPILDTESLSRIRGRPRREWVDEVRRDQSARWTSGQHVTVEEYLKCLPELTEDEEDTLVLICGEILMRRARAEEVTLDEYQRRFPNLSSQLRFQFDLEPLWTAPCEEHCDEQRTPISCPACHNLIEPSEEGASHELICTLCGSRFHLPKEVLTNLLLDARFQTLGHYELLEVVGTARLVRCTKRETAIWIVSWR
jgi:hypothetical protein